MKKLKIIYICGMGHNGSTMLDLLLDQCSQIASTSQLNDLLVTYDPQEVVQGERTHREEFWEGVLQELSVDQRHKLEELNRGVLKEKSLLSLFFSSKKRRQYAKINDLVLDVLSKKVACEAVVDSSKNVARAIGLTESECEIFVVHLVRDLRGFVCSHNKRQLEQGKRLEYLKPAVLWYGKNTAASLLVPFRAPRRISLRYEECMREPEVFLGKLQDFLAIDLDECLPGLLGECQLHPSETLGFAGNRVLHKRESFRIDRSRSNTKAPLFRSRWFWFLLGWPTMAWGYRFRTELDLD